MPHRTVSLRHGIAKVLVANRGEIACRVFRTCRAMNIRTVAVCCEGEPNARHVKEADEAFVLGPPPASSSYLRGDRVIEAARRVRADAVHPGYGFLSENPEFAAAVEQAGLAFIGPPATAISSMGSKSESKRIMEAAGVPVVPGYYGDDQTPERLLAEAKQVGFPVLIKAVSGGGGKGMKIVRDVEEFELMLESAKREAKNFFKDDRVLIERYIDHPRHIECQVFVDKFENGVFFFERDCSVQRRYQKIIEEAPAPNLSQETRERIGKVALTAAKAVGYVGAGTVEFIFDTDADKFFFMEMNTRLQVEHPVTEEVCRVKGKPLDLVRLQIETAQGVPLGFTQEDISLHGVCLETRIYAESPAKGFLPVSGRLAYIKEPPIGHRGVNTRVRLDTGFRSGDNVLVHYDPMIAKLVVWGEDRQRALDGMRVSLDSYHVVGVQTNIEFLKRCLESDDFVQGGVTTRFIEEHQEELLRPVPMKGHLVALAALSLTCTAGVAGAPLRLNHVFQRAVPLYVNDARMLVQLAAGNDSVFTCTCEGVEYKIVLERVHAQGGGSFDLTAQLGDGWRLDFTAVVTEKEVALILPEGTYSFGLHPLDAGFGDASLQGAASVRVVSPMPGKVTKLFVASGAQVKRGQAILVLEAMKMEHVVKAASDGEVIINVKEGDMVTGGQLLATTAA